MLLFVVLHDHEGSICRSKKELQLSDQVLILLINYLPQANLDYTATTPVENS